MSLINRMLNDLDERRAIAGDVLRGHSDIRPLPPPRPAIWPRFAAVGVLVGAAVAGTWLYLTYGPARPLPVLPAPATKDAVNASLPPLASAAESPAPAQLPTPEGAPAVAVATESGGEKERLLRLSAQLSSLPNPRPESVRPTPPAPVPPVAAKPVPTPVPTPAPATPDAAASESGRIDKQGIETTPHERAERLYRSALGLLSLGRNDEGLTTMRAALQEDVRHVAARQWLIKHYVDGRAFDAAQGVLQDGLGVLPQQTAWSLLLSRLYADRGDNARALKTLEEALPHATGSPELDGALGAILQRLGRHGDAEQRFAKATQSEPGKARWWLGLALANEAQGKAGDARSAFQKAAALKNLSPDLQAFVEQKLN